jgi:hypothetical protein
VSCAALRRAALPAALLPAGDRIVVRVSMEAPQQQQRRCSRRGLLPLLPLLCCAADVLLRVCVDGSEGILPQYAHNGASDKRDETKRDECNSNNTDAAMPPHTSPSTPACALGGRLSSRR